MSVMDISDEDQNSVLSIIAGILHMGNINFVEQGNYAQVADDECKFTRKPLYIVFPHTNL